MSGLPDGSGKSTAPGRPGLSERLTRDTAAGEMRDGDTRYVMLRADTLMGLFKALPADARLAALDALRRSVAEHGGKSAAAYRAMGAAERDDFLNVVVETAAELGWGAWRFTEVSDTSIALEVANSPFAEGHGPADIPVCAAIEGMLEAIAGLVLGRDMSATETHCASVAGNTCRFRTVSR